MNAQWNAPMYQSMAMNNLFENPRHWAVTLVYEDFRPFLEWGMNLYQMLVYAFILYLLCKNRCADIGKYAMLIGVYGGFLFSMMWEAKTRYVFPYFIMMLPYAAVGMSDFFRREDWKVWKERTV